MIRDTLKQELIAAMKAKEETKVATIRLINATLKDKDIQARTKGVMDGISEAEVCAALQGMVKQRRDSIEAYAKGGRQDLVDKEQAEIDLIMSFLPKQMDEAETQKAVQEVIATVGATSVKDMGKVMGALKEKYQGQMDFAKASAVIKGLLS